MRNQEPPTGKGESLVQNGWMHWLNSKSNCSSIFLILCVKELVTLAGYYCILSQSIPPYGSE